MNPPRQWYVPGPAERTRPPRVQLRPRAGQARRLARGSAEEEQRAGAGRDLAVDAALGVRDGSRRRGPRCRRAVPSPRARRRLPRRRGRATGGARPARAAAGTSACAVVVQRLRLHARRDLHPLARVGVHGDEPRAAAADAPESRALTAAARSGRGSGAIASTSPRRAPREERGGGCFLVHGFSDRGFTRARRAAAPARAGCGP